MKRLLTVIVALSMSISVCLPVQAQFSFQEDATVESSTEAAAGTEEAADTAAEEDTAEETASTEPDAEESSAAGATDTGAGEGTADAAAYGVEKLKKAPDVTAESALLMDAESGAILYGKDEDSKQYPASITKVMTALITIENCSMDEIVTFSNEAVNGIEAGSSSAGINVGAELTVEDTLYAMMLVSANEAAAALAEHVAGSNEAFADLMNQRAQELGCTGTHFVNPHGLPDEDHYTTAHDMGLILQQAMKYDEFRKIAEADTYTLQKSDTLTDTLELWNHSKIIRENSDYYYEYAEGSKPGYTQAALNTLVTYAKKDNVELICVILKDYGADNSYYDTTNLFEWGFEQVKGITPLSSFNLTEALRANSDITEDELTNIQRLNCTFPEDYYILVQKDFDDSTLKTAFVMDEDTRSGRIGYINITAGDTVIGAAPVTYDMNSEAAQSYLSSGSADDDLETAPVDEGRLTPSKVFTYIVRAVVVLIIVAILISFLRRRQAEKRRQQRILERKKKHASSNTRSSGGYSRTGTGRTTSYGNRSRTASSSWSRSSSTGSGSGRASSGRTTGSTSGRTSSGRTTGAPGRSGSGRTSGRNTSGTGRTSQNTSSRQRRTGKKK